MERQRQMAHLLPTKATNSLASAVRLLSLGATAVTDMGLLDVRKVT